MSLEALLGLTAAFDPALQAAGGQPGQASVAACLCGWSKAAAW